MKLKISILFSLIFISICCQSQTIEIENRTIDYYFEQIGELELKQLLEQKILKDSVTLSEKYKDSTSNRLNREGFQKYAEIKMNIYQTFFKDYLYQQKVEYGNDIYVLYFTMAGFDDMQWDIIKWTKDNWNGKERLSREKAENDKNIEKILWNYDEAGKNLENIRIFIKNDYLVMERGNLYHSLYDLKNKKVILNEESPWNASDNIDKTEMNKWIKENLHDKIENYINTVRE
ncbi:hypothetical protein [Flavobacterium sp.]|uniref:hypothetical protein n=1 Tax=Flavobacterium sp. TaxID=239 RepID=UPI0040481F68